MELRRRRRVEWGQGDRHGNMVRHRHHSMVGHLRRWLVEPRVARDELGHLLLVDRANPMHRRPVRTPRGGETRLEVLLAVAEGRLGNALSRLLLAGVPLLQNSLLCPRPHNVYVVNREQRAFARHRELAQSVDELRDAAQPHGENGGEPVDGAPHGREDDPPDVVPGVEALWRAFPRGEGVVAEDKEVPCHKPEEEEKHREQIEPSALYDQL
mmetsp:Transcript_34446/g.80506  ORF Transcript_34446/g.80506 Transcript_34446/m.80506 type:complete len:212 (-) Transcript_34446:277-912(-)